MSFNSFRNEITDKIFIIRVFRFSFCLSRYFLNVLADMSSGLLQVFVQHGNLHETSFIETTGVACSDSVSHNRVEVLSIPALLLAYSEDWTYKWLSP